MAARFMDLIASVVSTPSVPGEEVYVVMQKLFFTNIPRGPFYSQEEAAAWAEEFGGKVAQVFTY